VSEQARHGQWMSRLHEQRARSGERDGTLPLNPAKHGNLIEVPGSGSGLGR
jgi:hypothetical protein